MDLTPMHKRVIALDVHLAKITACAVVEHDDGRVVKESGQKCGRPSAPTLLVKGVGGSKLAGRFTLQNEGNRCDSSLRQESSTMSRRTNRFYWAKSNAQTWSGIRQRWA